MKGKFTLVSLFLLLNFLAYSNFNLIHYALEGDHTDVCTDFSTHIHNSEHHECEFCDHTLFTFGSIELLTPDFSKISTSYTEFNSFYSFSKAFSFINSFSNKGPPIL